MSLFGNIIKNKLFMTLLVVYILIGTLIFYYNSAEWMQYRGAYVASLDDHEKTISMLDRLLEKGDISQESYDVAKQKAIREQDISFHKTDTWGEYIDEEEENVKAFGHKAWNLFLQYKVFFYILFSFVAFISLLFAWLKNPLPKSKIDAIPNEYFKDLFLVVFSFCIILFLMTIGIYFFSSHMTIDVVINLISILIIGFGLSYLFNKTEKSISVLILGVIGAIVGYFIKGWPTSFLGTIIGAILGGVDSLSSLEPRTNFIINIIKLIPCFFIYLADKTAEQLKMTNKKTWVYLLIEFGLIGLRFLIPFLYRLLGNLLMPKHNTLLTKPVSLHHLTSLGIFENSIQKRDNNFAERGYLNYNYAISFWIWIIPQPSSTSAAYNRSTSLVNLSDIVKINFNKNKIEILAASTESSENYPGAKGDLIKVYEQKEIIYQKWNNFIINYNGSTLDIFINGELVSSTPNITPVINFQSATAGEENGIYGGIKNVVYYLNPLSKREINIISRI